jgi:transcriptional regulator with XRE-family HTH domain
VKNQELISNIADLRIKARLTQLELSRKVNVTESTIANWETGRSDLKWIDRVIRLCDALDCQPKDLINKNEGVSSSEILEEHKTNKRKLKEKRKKVS